MKKFNFNKAIFPGIQGGPLMHVIAAKAVCFKEALQRLNIKYISSRSCEECPGTVQGTDEPGYQDRIRRYGQSSDAGGSDPLRSDR